MCLYVARLACEKSPIEKQHTTVLKLVQTFASAIVILNLPRDIWVPQITTERNCHCRVDVCDFLLKHQENDPFLKRVETRYGLAITMSNTKGQGVKNMNWLKAFRKWILIEKR